MESNRQVKFHLHELALVLFFMKACTSDIFPKAQNVTWSSLNFKTILMWSPKPTNHSYTVEFSQVGQDRERTPHCIRTMATECDLTAGLKNLKAYYSADILSEPMQGISSDLVEFPHVSSEKYSPYYDKKISKSSIIELTDLDQESYCFYVQAFLPFRAQDKQHGEISNIQCSSEEIFEGNA
ncbi:hypothetical protein cypCar_00048487 [Cyprinus carpio]|nr:hypothetical protein cypCar_00048487 [Cyprinus carpio]